MNNKELNTECLNDIKKDEVKNNIEPDVVFGPCPKIEVDSKKLLIAGGISLLLIALGL